MTPKEATEALIRIAKQSNGNADYHKQLEEIYGIVMGQFDKPKEDKTDGV